MAEMDKACQTPLLDLLRAVPPDARAEYEHHSFSHSMIPYGRYCAEAAAEIASLRTALSAAQGERDEMKAAKDDLYSQLVERITEKAAMTKRAEEAERERTGSVETAAAASRVAETLTDRAERAESDLAAARLRVEEMETEMKRFYDACCSGSAKGRAMDLVEARPWKRFENAVRQSLRARSTYLDQTCPNIGVSEIEHGYSCGLCAPAAKSDTGPVGPRLKSLAAAREALKKTTVAWLAEIEGRQRAEQCAKGRFNALLNYGRHWPSCSQPKEGKACDCGLDGWLTYPEDAKLSAPGAGEKKEDGK